MVVITDKNGLIEYVNPKFTEVTGYEISEVINQNPKILASGRTDPSIYQNMWKPFAAAPSGEESSSTAVKTDSFIPRPCPSPR